MKVHTDLKELLVDFLNTLDNECVLIERIDIAKTVKHYTSTNSLALGKPEPLAKNKQTENKCECKKPQFTRTVDEDFNPTCGRCGKPL